MIPAPGQTAEWKQLPAKTCRSCKLKKRKSAFANHAHAKDGKRRDCKHCMDHGAVKPPKRKLKNCKATATRKTPDYLAKNREAARRWYWANCDKALANQRAQHGLVPRVKDLAAETGLLARAVSKELSNMRRDAWLDFVPDKLETLKLSRAVADELATGSDCEHSAPRGPGLPGSGAP